MIDYLLAELDRALAPSALERARQLDRLRAAVGRLDDWTPAEPEDTVAVPRRDRPEPRTAPPPPPSRVIELPRRTTHGGPWGPKLREKFIAEALERDPL